MVLTRNILKFSNSCWWNKIIRHIFKFFYHVYGRPKYIGTRNKYRCFFSTLAALFDTGRPKETPPFVGLPADHGALYPPPCTVSSLSFLFYLRWCCSCHFIQILRFDFLFEYQRSSSAMYQRYVSSVTVEINHFYHTVMDRDIKMSINGTCNLMVWTLQILSWCKPSALCFY